MEREGKVGKGNERGNEEGEGRKTEGRRREEGGKEKGRKGRKGRK